MEVSYFNFCSVFLNERHSDGKKLSEKPTFLLPFTKGVLLL